MMRFTDSCCPNQALPLKGSVRAGNLSRVGRSRRFGWSLPQQRCSRSSGGSERAFTLNSKPLIAGEISARKSKICWRVVAPLLPLTEVDQRGLTRTGEHDEL